MKIKTLENMSLHRQNKNGDFVYHVQFIDGNGEASTVPSKVTIELSTETGKGSFVAEYDAEGESSGCRKSGDGLDLFIPLSRTPIGTGRMLAKITAHIHRDGFSSNEQNICTKTTTNVLLWDGPSDGAISIEGSVSMPEQ